MAFCQNVSLALGTALQYLCQAPFEPLMLALDSGKCRSEIYGSIKTSGILVLSLFISLTQLLI